MRNIHKILAGLVGITLISTLAFSSSQESADDLKQKIEKLQKRVEELESQQKKQVKPKSSPFNFFHRKQTDSWDPFSDIQRMQEEMDRMFSDSFRFGGGLSKGMFRSDMFYDDNFKMKEKKDKYIIEFDMTGLDQSKVDIEVTEQNITVKGERSAEETEEAKNRYFSSKSFGSFLKTISTPKDADTSKMSTDKKGDKLIITLPKKK